MGKRFTKARVQLASNKLRALQQRLAEILKNFAGPQFGCNATEFGQKRSHSKAVFPNHRSTKRSFESLECRIAMAVTPAPLSVQGTTGNDSISITAYQGSFYDVLVNLNGVQSGPFKPLGPISINALAGNDTVSISPDISLDSIIDGGAGADHLTGGSGNDEFLVRDGEEDIIEGGLGNNSAATDSKDLISSIQYLNPVTFDTSNEPQSVRVMVLNYEPRIPSENNQKLWQVFNWHDPRKLASEYEFYIEQTSGSMVNIDIVQWRDLNSFPTFTDGFVYDPEQCVINRRSDSGWHNGQIDVPRIVAEQGIASLVDSGEVDEVWYFGDHFMIAGPIGESWMSGPGAFFINGPTFPQIPTQRAFASMGFNYERSMNLHTLGHRTEATLNRIYGGWDLANPENNWERFSANYAQSNGLAGVGTTHWPANASSDYDTFNTRIVSSWADDYLNYPNLTGETTQISRESWAHGSNVDYERDYQNWYFSHLPRANGTNADGKQNNWWKYVFDFNNYTHDGRPIPLVANAIALDVFNSGDTTYQFSISYSGAIAAQLNSIDDGDAEVTGPNGYRSVARLVRTNSELTSNYTVATYEIDAPGGNWDQADAGKYQIGLLSSEVADVQGNYVDASIVGAFQFRDVNGVPLSSGTEDLLTLNFEHTLIGANGEIPTATNEIAFAEGKVAQGLNLAAGGRVKYETDNNILTDEGTVQFWLKPSWSPHQETSYFFQAGNVFNNSLLFSIDGANNLRFIAWGDNPATPTTEVNFESGVAHNVNSWNADEFHHVAATWSNSSQTIELFVDGKLVDSNLFPSISEFSRENLVIGSEYDGAVPSFSMFDEFQISSRVSSRSEIASDFRAGLKINELSVEAPSLVEAGVPSSAKAIALDDAGVRYDVTSQANWSSSDGSVLTIDSNGYISPLTSGSASITAQLGTLSATQ